MVGGGGHRDRDPSLAVAGVAASGAPSLGTYKGLSSRHFPVMVLVSRAPANVHDRALRVTVVDCQHSGHTLAFPPTASTPMYHFRELVRVATIGVPVTLYRISGAGREHPVLVGAGGPPSDHEPRRYAMRRGPIPLIMHESIEPIAGVLLILLSWIFGFSDNGTATRWVPEEKTRRRLRGQAQTAS